MNNFLIKDKLVNQPVNIVKLLFVYIVAANIFQIFFMDVSHSHLNNLWKTLVLAGALLFVAFKVRKNPLVNKNYWPFFILICVYQVINSIVSGDIPGSMQDITRYIFLPVCYLIFILLLGRYVISEKQLIKFFKYFIFFVIYACVINVAINFNALSTLSSDTKAYELSLSSFFDNRNTFGLYLLVGAASNVYVLLKERNSKLYKFTLFIMLINLLFTLSRTSIFAFIAFIVTFAILQRNIWFIAKLTAVSIIIGASLALLPAANSFISNNVIRADAGLSGRDHVYSYSVYKISHENTLFGSGYNKPLVELEQNTGFKGFHNSYFSILIHGGLSLMLLFLAAMAFSLKKSSQIRKSNRVLGNFFIAFLASYLLYSFTESLVIFFPSIPNFIATVFVIFLPLYISNYYSGPGKVIKP